jgi:hypothetical protein
MGVNGSIEEYPIRFDGNPDAGINVEIPKTTKTATTGQ